ncbi:uncharacterized protein LOC114274874, partial [Camellia sinensis]|uniref:uncharacterized protein LOC114274874 n=1 Tax=Camellia sinensis TaxID=4442 RepID=UPI001036D80E
PNQPKPWPFQKTSASQQPLILLLFSSLTAVCGHRSSSTSTPTRHQQQRRQQQNSHHKDCESFSTEKPIGNKQSKSFSYVERGVKAGKEDDGEEKMDMLWEDLNEEISRTYGSKLEYSEMSPAGKVAEFGRVQVFSGKKSSVVVVYMKVLKKLFSLNSQRSIKKRTWW